ncbi:MAG: hypothetical protein INF18_04970 [Methylobacterium sp.]|nr:hypothetical protein [Methylobacterium sp.]MCA3637810.1 hypothetical protein [Methylobacterium sp.]
MLEIFRKLKAGPVSATALREARAALDPHVAETTVRRREDARREAILSGDPKEIARAESALTDARLEAERVKIAMEELESRIADADRREADEAVSARVREIEARRDALRRRVTRDVAPALKVTCDVLTEVAALDAEIDRANGDFASTGRAERIAATEEGFTPYPDGAYWPIWALRATITIRPIADWGVSGWNWPATSPA